MAFDKLTPGQSWPGPSASFHNATVDALNWMRGQQQGSHRPPQMPGSDGSADVVTVRNDSGADLDQFGVLGIDGAIFTPTDNSNLFKSRVLLKGITPTIAD